MYFEIIILKEELDDLEKTAYDLMRREHVRKTDRRLIVESFKEIKERLKKIKDHKIYIIAGDNEEELDHPETLGFRGFSWNAGEWSLVFVEPKEGDIPSDNFFEAILGGANIIDYECSLDLE